MGKANNPPLPKDAPANEHHTAKGAKIVNDTAIDEEVAALESRLRNRGWNWAPTVLLFLGIVVGVTCFFMSDLLVYAKVQGTQMETPVRIGSVATTIVLLVLSAFWFLAEAFGRARIQEDLDILKARKRSFIKTEGLTSEGSYFDRLVNINLSNLEAYYAMVKVHTNKSFTASIGVGLIGFMLIVVGLIAGFSDFENSKVVAYISSGSGVITEFIAGVFFYLYNLTTRQLKEYHDSLIDVQYVLLSFKIVEDTPDNDTRLAMMKDLLKALLLETKGTSSPTSG